MIEMDNDTLDFAFGTQSAYIFGVTGVYPTSRAFPKGLTICV
jgi:hypothetical protein